MNGLDALYLGNPYEGFDFRSYPYDTQDDWFNRSPVFEELILKVRPELIIEVGSWKGGSAIHMAGLLKRHGITGKILCVDTWLGSWEHRETPKDAAELGYRHGYPTLYYKFLANVCHRGFHDVICPLPLPGQIAARALNRAGVQAHLVYIDASHEEDDAYADCKAYWPIVAKEGVLLLDDWDRGDVRAGVLRFLAEIDARRPTERSQNKAFVRK